RDCDDGHRLACHHAARGPHEEHAQAPGAGEAMPPVRRRMGRPAQARTGEAAGAAKKATPPSSRPTDADRYGRYREWKRSHGLAKPDGKPPAKDDKAPK